MCVFSVRLVECVSEFVISLLPDKRKRFPHLSIFVIRINCNVVSVLYYILHVKYVNKKQELSWCVYMMLTDFNTLIFPQEKRSKYLRFSSLQASVVGDITHELDPVMLQVIICCNRKCMQRK